MDIRFGTSGWRGIIAKEFTWERVNVVTDSIAVLLQRRGRKDIIVGGDCRFLSPELAENAAERLARYGFRVILSDRPCPTPALSHTCRRMDLGGIINFTASHNPPLYNGIKFSPWHGGPAEDALTSEIEVIISEGIGPKKGRGSVRRMDVTEDYMLTLMDYIDHDIFKGSDLRVVYDAFSGTGAGILDRLLVKLGASVRTINGKRDPLFAGRQHPEPGREGTSDLSREVVHSRASLGVATDGDADRFGIVDEEGKFVSPHNFLPLLLEYLVTKRGYRGRVVRSVTTGSLIDRVASAHGLDTRVTPVGFKYLGAEMLKGEVLLAGEESGGLSILNHVPEKDGIMACLLAAEMVCASGIGLARQLSALWERYGRTFVRRLDMNVSGALRDYISQNYFESTPAKIAGRKVTSSDRIDGVRMVFDDGDWVLIRMSGTEPLVRIYAQSGTAEVTDHLIEAVSGEFGRAAGKR